MKIKIILFITMLSGLVTNCNKNDDKDIFNGSIHYINPDDAIAKNVVSQQVPLTGDHTGMIAVYDSLLVCWDPSYQSHLVDVFNIDTGKEIGYFCERGQGPQEVLSANAVLCGCGRKTFLLEHHPIYSNGHSSVRYDCPLSERSYIFSF